MTGHTNQSLASGLRIRASNVNDAVAIILCVDAMIKRERRRTSRLHTAKEMTILFSQTDLAMSFEIDLGKSIPSEFNTTEVFM